MKHVSRIDRMSIEDISYYRVVGIGFGVVRWVKAYRSGRLICFSGSAALTEIVGIDATQHPVDTMLEVKTRTVAKVLKPAAKPRGVK